MKPPPFSYHDPRTVADAVGLLGKLDNAKLLAGGQSMMPMLNMRFVQPDHIIDLNKVEGLSYIREANGALEIGAMTRQREIEFSDVVKKRCPLMHEAIQHVGHRQTRNRGTIGGSLCHLDPSAELVTRRRRDRRDRDGAGPERHAQDRIRRLPGRLHDAGDRTERAGDGGEISVLAGRPRLRLRRVLAPARRLRHRLGGGAADRGRRRQDHARLGRSSAASRVDAGARHRTGESAGRPVARRQAPARGLREPAATTRRSRTSTRRPPTGSIWRR